MVLTSSHLKYPWDFQGPEKQIENSFTDHMRYCLLKHGLITSLLINYFWHT